MAYEQLGRIMARKVVKEELSHEDELLATIQQLASALQNALAQRPVGNAVVCFAAAEAMTRGTKYEFVRRP